MKTLLSPVTPADRAVGGDSSARTRRIAWALLAIAMAIAAAWIMVAARNTTFAGDDLYYYARYITHGIATEPGHGLEYFLAPHNGHLQAGGKLLYRVLFDVAGADYTVFRLVNLAALLAAVTLFYVLARRRVGPLAALAPSILLLFLGYAWEPLIWAFDMHTTIALALGLGALLALERSDRRGDVWACVLLVLAVSMIELGLAFVAGAAVSVLLRPDRRRRAWIFLVPIALYAIWWVWARKFDQSSIDLRNVHLIPIVIAEALSAIAGSVTGLNPTGADVFAPLTTVTAAGTVLAGFAVFGLALRVRRGGVPASLWAFLAVAVAYWITIALAGREPDSSRYILAGTVLVLLVAADALAGLRFPALALAGLFVVVALAIPPNIAKFYDGRRWQLNDAEASRTEYAMLELERDRVEPGYTPSNDPAVGEAGGSVFVPLPAGEYFRAADETGPLGYSLGQVRSQPLNFRQVADATLVGALGIHLDPAGAPANRSGCLAIADASAQDPAYFPLPHPGILLGARSSAPVEVRLKRFAPESGGTLVGKIPPGSWAQLHVPPDRAPDQWQVVVNGPTRACPAPG